MLQIFKVFYCKVCVSANPNTKYFSAHLQLLLINILWLPCSNILLDRPEYTFETKINKNCFRVCSAYAEIGSTYAQPIGKLVPRMLSICRNHFRVCSACAEIGSPYAQSTMKLVPRRLSIHLEVHEEALNIYTLTEHTQKLVPRMLSLR
jgi:hypothetical protein